MLKPSGARDCIQGSACKTCSTSLSHFLILILQNKLMVFYINFDAPTWHIKLHHLARNFNIFPIISGPEVQGHFSRLNFRGPLPDTTHLNLIIFHRTGPYFFRPFRNSDTEFLSLSPTNNFTNTEKVVSKWLAKIKSREKSKQKIQSLPLIFEVILK